MRVLAVTACLAVLGSSGSAQHTIALTITSPAENTVLAPGVTVEDPAPSAQPPLPALQITAPKNGTVVAPGQSVTVTVTSPSSATFRYVRVIGYRPLQSVAVATALPAQFPVRVPASAAAGRYPITAMGESISNEVVESVPIEIDVERPGLPVTLLSLMPTVYFEETGERIPITLKAVFSDALPMDVSRSSRVTYSSSAPPVATVDSDGVIKSVGPGRATITATYTAGPAAIRTVVSVTVPKTPLPE